ncbi:MULTISPECIES: hypothetical protein [Pantoea]|jgi:hypothetical protein|uniref:hypothetical protein n=1 Tax=Pantoea TaxID=53335 RepID=UPI001F16438C|nr:MULTISPECIES: hypothetical protein [Pantoea]UIL53210.1 hypothetical protein LZU96_04395 [Pantoea agglomerans]
MSSHQLAFHNGVIGNAEILFIADTLKSVTGDRQMTTLAGLWWQNRAFLVALRMTTSCSDGRYYCGDSNNPLPPGDYVVFSGCAVIARVTQIKY